MTPPCPPRDVLDLVERIGRDYALVPTELGTLSPAAAEALPGLWAAYQRHWGGFCGARLDPMHAALGHPARMTGTIRVPAGDTVIVVGTGPSLGPALPTLCRVRPAVHLVTSPRGADALAEAGLVPDLVYVEHETALDAQFSVGDRAHRASRALAAVPLVASDVRTPAALLDGIAVDRLVVPEAAPSWGLWPATAVALAIGGGAGQVALLGIDLGTRARPDPRFAPLADLLGLLGRAAGVPCVDLGPGGAAKAHWTPSTIDALAGVSRRGPLVVDGRPSISRSTRQARAAAVWRRLHPVAALASETLVAAGAVRDGDRSRAAVARVAAGLARLVDAGDSLDVRVDVQDGLGATFLPRFWRTPPDLTLGPALWRAAAMAGHEIVRQHRSLASVTECAA